MKISIFTLFSTIAFTLILLFKLPELSDDATLLIIIGVSSSIATLITTVSLLLSAKKFNLRAVLAGIILAIFFACVIGFIINKIPPKPENFDPNDTIVVKKNASIISDETSTDKANTFKVPDSFKQNRGDIFPAVNSDNISSILIKPYNVFELFEKTGILNKGSSSFETYSLANKEILDATQSIIPAYNETYGSIMKKVDRMYLVLFDNYYNRLSDPVIGIDEVIIEYGNMIKYQETAKEWSKGTAKGVSLDLIALIARNYKEKADLHYKRNKRGDITDAVENYIKAIMEYALFYRMCQSENLTQRINDYRTLYWIATIYHYLGDIQREQHEFPFRLGSFTTADVFFNKHSGLGGNETFKAYSKYYSAMASHKLYNSIEKNHSNKLPRELKHYLQDAYINYKNSKESGELKQSERAEATRAFVQIADACLEYLKQYPDEENGDIMKSRAYYEK